MLINRFLDQHGRANNILIPLGNLIHIAHHLGQINHLMDPCGQINSALHLHEKIHEITHTFHIGKTHLLINQCGLRTGSVLEDQLINMLELYPSHNHHCKIQFNHSQNFHLHYVLNYLLNPILIGIKGSSNISRSLKTCIMV